MPTTSTARRSSWSENVPLARDTYRIRFESPRLARRIVPGQFVMMRLAGCNDPLLGRPLALYDVAADAAGRGPGGHRLPGRRQDDPAAGRAASRARRWRSGDRWATAFRPTPAEHLVMVAGGIGQTPFLALAKEYLGLQGYGDPPRRGPRGAAGDALLRLPQRRNTWPASRISGARASRST